ncbi:MAG: BCCT family transporter [Bacillota bacterium]|jgi:glycine betaine transporter
MRSGFSETVDKKVFFIGGFVCLLILIFAVVNPAAAETFFSWLLTVFCTDFSWLYLLAVAAFILILLCFALGRYGNVVLGKDDEKPEYSTFSWFFMLFSAGMGIGLVFWSVAEPMSHYLAPPLGAGSTPDAAVNAMRYSFLHWGIHPWACYGVIGLPLAYFQFRKGKPALLSSCVAPIVGEKHANGLFGSVIDVLAVFATVFGVATSLGLGAMQINSGLHYVFGVPYHHFVMLLIITVTTVLFISTSVAGIDRGIKVCSDINIALMLLLLVFVLFAGSTLFVLGFFVDSFGQYLAALVSDSFWSDPFGESDGWLNSWTVFYWAWWISWGPFVGGFIARISRGRTVRQFVFGTLLCPMILSVIFITVMGGSAIRFDMAGVSSIASAMDENISYATFALLEQFPLTKLTSFVTVVLISVFFITSANSSTFVCAMMTAKGVQEPPVFLKVFWGLAESSSAAILLFVGGLTALQSASILSALPMIFVCFLLLASFGKTLREETLLKAPD